MTVILDGRIIREQKTPELKKAILKLEGNPSLAIIQIGDLSESSAYIEQKKKFGEKIGVSVSHIKKSEDVTEQDLIAEITRLNSDRSVHGIIIQLPVPQHLNLFNVIEAIDPAKDVDGLTSFNLKKLWSGENSGFVPATARGILGLLDFYEISVSGKKVTVVGRSNLVGKPTVALMLSRDATVTVCHSKTPDLVSETGRADILIVAAGEPKLIGENHVSSEQVVIDVGINPHTNLASSGIGVGVNKLKAEGSSGDLSSGEKLQEEIPDYHLLGDVDFEEVKDKVSAISPVPGGVGPMTVLSLFENLLEAYKRQGYKK